MAAADPLEALIFQARSVGELPATDYQVPYRDIYDLLARQTRTYRDKPWLIYYSEASGRHEYSYRQFFELVCRTARFLLDQGISRGDRIATINVNHAATVVQYFAAWAIGAVVVPVNLGEDDQRVGYILQHSLARLAFVGEPFIARIEAILAQAPGAMTIVRVGGEPARDSAAAARIQEFHVCVGRCLTEFRLDYIVSLEDEALIVYTSGTTGLPKGVVLTQYNLLIDAKAIAEWHGMTADQRMMCVLPIHHVNGTVVTLVTPMYFGGSVVLCQKFRTDVFFERIAAEKVNVASVVPTLLQFLLHENPDTSQYDLAHFRHVICGAGPLTVELAAKFEDRFHIPIVHGYGLSETTCYSCFLPLDLSPEEHRRWLRDCGFPSIGVPLPPNEMAIHDDCGNPLPGGTRGEIVIRGHNVMKRYYGNAEANRAVFAFGWFRSGDEGFFTTDDQGRQMFFITGRIKELIIRGGINVSPFEIDEVLMNMPGVKAGLAVGFDNDWYGEEIGAYVQPAAGIALTEAEVIAYCRQFFSFQKCPKVVVFGNDIPVTSTGKYQRSRLKTLFAPWKTVQFTESRSRKVDG
jgi:acyl-CoA synthetase (AMP-forming)/AMP-acid ligase II